MREKEKMIAGALYNAGDNELVADRQRAFSWMKQLNDAFDAPQEERAILLAEGLDHIGTNSVIRSPFYCDYGYNIFIGNNVFINFNCVILDGCRVVIGDNTEIAPNVQIMTATHPTDPEIRAQKLEYSKPIHIGKTVWIGASALILPGVTIGDGAVIGAGAVVTRDVAANTTVVNNPARILKKQQEKI